MEFVIDKKRLESVVALLANYVEKKDPAAINANICIIAENDELLLRASDGEMGINYYIRGCEIKTPGKVFLHAKRLGDILKGLENSDLKISKSENKIKITQKNTRYSMAAIDGDDFVFMEENSPRTPLALNTFMLSSGLKIINSSIDSTSISLQFNCAHVQITPEEVSFVGSDSKIVSVMSYAGQFGANEKIVLTKRALIELLKLLNEEVRAYKNDNYFIIENDNFTFFTRVINIDLLPYKAIMPKAEPSEQVWLNTAQIMAEVKKISAVSDKCLISFDAGGKITFSNGPLSDELAANACSEIAAELAIKENFEVFLNVKYLLDFLHNNTHEEFVLNYYQSGAPVVLKNENYFALVASIKK